MSILGENPVKAVDMSFDWLTSEEADRLIALGYELVIQCAWTGRVQPRAAVSNLNISKNRGLAIATYTSLSGGASVGQPHVESGLTKGHHGAFPIYDSFGSDLLFNMVDIELPGITVEAVEDAYTHTRDALHLLAPIYTSYNAWRNYVVPGNSTRLARLGAPLVNAYWDNDDDVDFPNLRYGGWRDEQLVGEQYGGGRMIGGQFVDPNVFRRSFVFPEDVEQPVEEGDDEMAVSPILVYSGSGEHEHVYLTDWLTRRFVGLRGSNAVAELVYIGFKPPVQIPSTMLSEIPTHE